MSCLNVVRLGTAQSVQPLATGWKGPGIETRRNGGWGGGNKIFQTCPDRPWGPNRLLYDGYGVSLPEVKRIGSGGIYGPPSSAEVKDG
jgi:hypothetical protein